MDFETIAPLLICAVLVATAMAAMALRARVPARWREDEPSTPLTAHFLTVMTSLLLGLMLNSARTTFEGVNHNVQTAATQATLLDRTLRRYGPETAPARHDLLLFAQTIRGVADGGADSHPLEPWKTRLPPWPPPIPATPPCSRMPSNRSAPWWKRAWRWWSRGRARCPAP